MDNEIKTAPGGEIKASELLTVSPSPHAKRAFTTASVMKEVIIALLPATVWGVYIYGLRAALVVLAAVLSSVLCEALIQLARHRTVTVSDCSAALTGLLLGLNLSPTVPMYVPILGSAFAIVIVKQLFGGLGKNFMNPALAARVFLVMCWGTAMGSFPAPYTRVMPFAPDVVSSATPLAALKTGEMPSESLLDLFLGRNGGCIGELSVLMLLIGGIYLIVRRIIDWRIPVSFLGTVALISFLFPLNGADNLTFMLASLCSGGLMLGAFFMATDYVTSPVTAWGRVIFGVGCGLLVIFLRYFSGMREGVSYAILIMNALVWYLDMATKPRVYGLSRRKRKEERA